MPLFRAQYYFNIISPPMELEEKFNWKEKFTQCKSLGSIMLQYRGKAMTIYQKWLDSFYQKRILCRSTLIGSLLRSERKSISHQLLVEVGTRNSFVAGKANQLYSCHVSRAVDSSQLLTHWLSVCHGTVKKKWGFNCLQAKTYRIILFSLNCSSCKEV